MDCPLYKNSKPIINIQQYDYQQHILIRSKCLKRNIRVVNPFSRGGQEAKTEHIRTWLTALQKDKCKMYMYMSGMFNKSIWEVTEKRTTGTKRRTSLRWMEETGN